MQAFLAAASMRAGSDPASLKSAVQEMCAEFGKLTRFDILTIAEGEKRKALCFLRLESEAQETQLMASLGACRFGDDVLMIVDFAAGAVSLQR